MNPRLFVMMVLVEEGMPLNVVYPLNGPLVFAAFQVNASAIELFECVSSNVLESQANQSVALGV